VVKIKASVMILRPIVQVLAVAWDPQKRYLWLPEKIDRLPLAPGESGDGRRTRSRVHGWAGLALEITQECQEVVPNRQYVFNTRESHGWFTSREQWDYEPLPDGTQVTVQHDVSLHGWLKLAGPVLIPAARKKVKDDLVRLKGLVEG
jgi:uncharacterized protein YndB with AHSA1/START domain